MTEHFVKLGDESNINIEGFRLATLFQRLNQKRGGSCILVRDDLDCDEILEAKEMSKANVFECCGVYIGTVGLIILCVYRVPGSNYNLFLDQFEHLLSKILKKDRKIIVIGDFNVDFLNIQSKSTKLLTGLIANFNLIPQIKNFTHVTSRSKTCIDNILTNIKGVGRVLELGLSRHAAQTFLTEGAKLPILQYWYEIKRDFSDENRKKFYDAISSLTFSDILLNNDLDTAFSDFFEILILFLNLCFPIVTVKKNAINKKLWITKGIRISSISKRNLYLKARIDRSNSVVSRYLRYSRTLRRCVEASHKRCNENYITNSSNICRATWKVVKGNVLTRPPDLIKQIEDSQSGKLIKDPQELCETFNRYFIENVESNCNQGKTVDILQYLETNNETMFLRPTDNDEVIKVIKGLKNTNAVGYDEISTLVLKDCALPLSKPLAHLVNLSFEQGVFPGVLKKTVIKPIHKRGSKERLSQYRPVALIPVISKILEKLMLIRLRSFISKCNILDKNQYGFIPNSNTTLAVFNLMRNVVHAMDRSTLIAALFMDLKSAFDFVSHETLLNKLSVYGVRGTVNKWIQTYLSDREQCTTICSLSPETKIVKAHQSDYRVNSYGVPQGSILGPFLFILYLNDMPRSIDDKMTLYADDSVVMIQSQTVTTYEEKINEDLAKIGEWLKSNNLILNADKTKFIQFHHYQAKPPLLHIEYDGKKIEQISSTSFLGIIVDEHINWKQHCETLCSKINRYIYVLKRIVRVSSLHAGKLAYHGYVNSNLRYGLPLWGNSTQVQTVFVAQKKCIRALCSITDQSVSCRPLFRKLSILPLCCLYIYEMCVFIKKYPNLFTLKPETHSVRLREENRGKLDFPGFKLSTSVKSVFNMSVTVYNHLPRQLRNLDLKKIKTPLFQWLLENCFYDINEFLAHKD